MNVHSGVWQMLVVLILVGFFCLKIRKKNGNLPLHKVGVYMRCVFTAGNLKALLAVLLNNSDY